MGQPALVTHYLLSVKHQPDQPLLITEIPPPIENWGGGIMRTTYSHILPHIYHIFFAGPGA